MYLLVTAGGKYWRMDYRFAEKRKTLALGVYRGLAGEGQTATRKTRELLADGIDPGIAQARGKTSQGSSGRKHL